VTALMNRSLTKVRGGMSENMAQAPPMWKHDIIANVATMAKVKPSIMSPWTYT
jgi:hypothetical protein